LGDANYSVSTGNLTPNQTVNKASLTVTADNQSRAYNTSNPALTYTITGFVNNETLTTSGVTGTAACTTTATTASANGTYPITCAAGTLAANNYAFTFVDGTLTVGKTASTTSVTSSLNPSTYGQNVIFTANVTSGATGQVRFSIDGTVQTPDVTLSASGTVTLSTASLTVGSHTVSAQYLGDANYAGSTGNLTPNQTVLAGSSLTAPSLTIAFTPSTIVPGGSAVLTFTLSNANATALTNATFNDVLPTQITMLNTTVGGSCVGKVTPPAAGTNGTIVVSGVTIPANGSCTITVNVTSKIAGNWTNTVTAITTTETGTTTVNATANLRVGAGPSVSAPNLTKAFAPSTIVLGDTSVLSFTLNNTNVNALTNVTFNDVLPTQVKMVNTIVGGTCVGTVTTPTAGTTGTIAVSGVTIPANGSCTITVNVTSNTPGSWTNTVTNMSTTETGSITVNATANLVVVAGTGLTTSFTPKTIAPSKFSVLSFTLNNTRSAALTNATFNDVLPTQIKMVNTIVGGSCVGTVTTPAAGTTGTIAVSGVTIPANGNCTITVNVTSNTLGSWTNTVTNMSTTETGSITVNATATLLVAIEDENKPPADLIGKLRVTPDRMASTDASNEISYTFSVRNVERGTAEFVRLELPIDPNLVVGYTRFTNPNIYVSEITTNSVKISIPPIENGKEMTGTVVFRPKLGITTETKIFTRFKLGYDDPAGAGRQRQSNGVTFMLSSSGANLNVSNGNVQLFSPNNVSVKAGEKQTFAANFFIPGEALDIWITKADGTSISLGGGRADEEGNYSLVLDTTGLAPGSYSISIFGQRSEVTGSGVLTITG
jgi:hypothetical protein